MFSWCICCRTARQTGRFFATVFLLLTRSHTWLHIQSIESEHSSRCDTFFQSKLLLCFLFLYEILCLEYLLEAHCRGASNGYPQHEEISKRLTWYPSCLELCRAIGYLGRCLRIPSQYGPIESISWRFVSVKITLPYLPYVCEQTDLSKSVRCEAAERSVWSGS